ncbi:MAG TPA: carboxypeptidase-like regulatory domain-containing protein [Solirubrobacterales bacterium]|nr:carboxypeptidase-like regulatory domain-containing protein [Solirubrobacterales bacterium]
MNRRSVARPSHLAIVAFACALTWAVASAARGATYEMRPCADLTPEYSISEWTPWSLNSGTWELQDKCKFSLELFSPAQSTYSTSTWFFRGGGRTIESVQVSMSGGNGLSAGKEQGIRLCGYDADSVYRCGDVASVTVDNPDVPEVRTLTPANGFVPEGAGWVEIVGRCKQAAGCAAAETLVIHDLRIVYRDDELPGLEILSDPSQTTPALISNGAWIGARGMIGFIASDAGSGVYYVKLKIGGLSTRYWYTGCGEDPAPMFLTMPCESTFEVYGEAITMAALQPQGERSLALTAVDMAGNKSLGNTFTHKFDSIPPAAPELITIDGATASGWVKSNPVTVRWTNDGEKGETATESGIAKTRYSVVATNKPATIFSPVTNQPIDSISGIQLPGEGKWKLSVGTIDRANNPSPIRAITVGLDSRVLDKPVLNQLPALSRDELLDGAQVTWTKPANAAQTVSGICGYAIAVNDSSSFDPGDQIDIHGDVTLAAIPPSLLEGAAYIHLRAISCSGVPGQASTLPIDIDLTAPQVSAAPAASNSWITTSQPVWIGANDSPTGSGIDFLTYSIDGQRPQTVSSSSTELWLGEGLHSIAYSATDRAGNVSPTHALSLGVDGTAPTGFFEAVNMDNPLEVRAVVSDVVSGIASASMEFRPEGDIAAGWRRLGEPATLDSQQNSLLLAADFPDDIVSPGVYELRVVATDVAGNVSENSARFDGSPAVLSSSVRPLPKLSAGFNIAQPRPVCAKRAKKRCTKTNRVVKPKLANRLLVKYGASAKLTGRLVDPAGNPMPGEALSVFSVIGGASTRAPIDELTTDVSGRYSLKVPAGPSRTIEVDYGGSRRFGEAQASAKLLTRGRVSLTFASRTVRSGQPIIFQGRVFHAGAEIPRSGKDLDLQIRSGRAWNEHDSVETSATGRFTARTTLKVKRPLRFRFRIRVTTQLGWPFESADSRTVTVVVKP